jgi:hypothetical protein
VARIPVVVLLFILGGLGPRGRQLQRSWTFSSAGMEASFQRVVCSGFTSSQRQLPYIRCIDLPPLFRRLDFPRGFGGCATYPICAESHGLFRPLPILRMRRISPVHPSFSRTLRIARW